MKKDSRTSLRGFSLVEVMVAMAVFGIAALGLAALNKVSMDAAVGGRERTNAANLAQFTMAWLQNEAGAIANGEALTNYPLIDTAMANVGDWQLLSGTDQTFRFDEHLGNSSEEIYTSGTDTAAFCVDYMISQFETQNETATSGQFQTLGNLYMVSVRVTWPRERRFNEGGDWTNCATRVTLLHPEATWQDAFHQLVMTQVLTTDFAQKI